TALLRGLVHGASDPRLAVAEVMHREVRTVGESEDAGRLRDLFEDDYAALVVDEADRLLGIITKMDLVEHLAEDLRPAASRTR
ncbi:MAG: CBS domain-containing protein, partial [Planctomycetota bacterium]